MNKKQDRTDVGIDLGRESSTISPIEEKYSRQMREVFPQKIELPISTLEAMIENQIQLDPEFQRRGRWDSSRRSRFIESLIMNVPIPPVFLGETDYSMYAVLDGRQRLTAVKDFLRNSYPLLGLRVWSELNGKRFDDLRTQGLDKYILRRFIPAVILLRESSPQLKYDVFDRLNTGGVVAREMEIRNAIFRGEFTRLIREELSQSDFFRRLWNIPRERPALDGNRLYSQMVDVELVLRFFALRDLNKYDKFSGTLADFLSLFLDERNSLYKTNPSSAGQDQSLFEAAVRNCWTVLEDTAFVKPGRRRVKSAPLADAQMQSLADVPTELLTPAISVELKRGFENLLRDADFRAAIEKGTNGRKVTRVRIEKAQALVASVLRRRD